MSTCPGDLGATEDIEANRGRMPAHGGIRRRSVVVLSTFLSLAIAHGTEGSSRGRRALGLTISLGFAHPVAGARMKEAAE